MKTQTSLFVLDEFNPFHDKNGRFSTHNTSTYVTLKTRSGKDVSHVARNYVLSKLANTNDSRTNLLPKNHPVRNLSKDNQKKYHDYVERYRNPQNTMQKDLDDRHNQIAHVLAVSWVDSSGSDGARVLEQSLSRLNLVRNTTPHPPSIAGSHKITESGDTYTFHDVPRYTQRVTKSGEVSYKQDKLTHSPQITHSELDDLVLRTYAHTQSQMSSSPQNLYRGIVGRTVTQLRRARPGTEIQSRTLNSYTDDDLGAFRFARDSDTGEVGVVLQQSVQPHDIFLSHRYTNGNSMAMTSSEQEMVVFGRRLRVTRNDSGPDTERSPIGLGVESIE
jgi:hypothetical protein